MKKVIHAIILNFLDKIEHERLEFFNFKSISNLSKDI